MNESTQQNPPQTRKPVSLELQRESLQLVSLDYLDGVVGGDGFTSESTSSHISPTGTTTGFPKNP
jgi:hypothetical protein